MVFSEVAERLQEINDVKAALADAQASIQRKEQEILKIHKMYAPGGAGDASGGNNTARMREELNQRWAELKTPLADRVDCLSAMLDAAPASPELVVSRIAGSEFTEGVYLCSSSIFYLN